MQAVGADDAREDERKRRDPQEAQVGLLDKVLQVHAVQGRDKGTAADAERAD